MWEPLKVSHHTATFGGHWKYDSEDMFSEVGEQNFTSSFNFAITIFLYSIWHVMLTHTKFPKKGNHDKNICQFGQENESTPGHVRSE